MNAARLLAASSCLLAAALIVACAPGPPEDDASRPDEGAPPSPSIVVWFVDTLRADHLSCYGNERQTSRRLDTLAPAGVSRALRADAMETVACVWLSVTTLGGLALNAWLGWWWADPAAALVLVPLIVREGVEAIRGECCSCADE